MHSNDLVMSEEASNNSHLPSWVIRMREKIEASRVNLASTQHQINTLVLNTITLDTEIQKSQLAARVSKDGDRNSGEEKAVIRAKICLFSTMPPDILCNVSTFLKINDVIAMDSSSKIIKDLMLSTAIWHLFLSAYPHLHFHYGNETISRISSQQIRQDVKQHYFDCKECIKFLRTMKEQRCVPKHKTIAPRMYTQSDTGISHPLPIFEQGTAVSSVGRIMSRTETMDRDFRSVALGAMETIARITSMPSELQRDLQRESAATIFISLLSNEAQQLKYLACSCLANLLCWEDHAHRSDSVRRQVELCDGAKVLLTLLTSPSASINLAGNLRNGASTAPIQGMCNREGARALVNLFSIGDGLKVPPNPPPESSPSYGCMGIKSDPDAMNEFIISEFPKLRAWRFSYFTRSGAVKDEFTCYMAFSIDGYCRGRGCDSIGFFILEGVAEVDIQGKSWKISKQYLSQSAMEELTGLLELQEEVPSIQRGGAHVVHTCYYTPGLTHRDEMLDGLYPRFGLFGVWESASTGSHYELQRGGVLRAVPVL